MYSLPDHIVKLIKTGRPSEISEALRNCIVQSLTHKVYNDAVYALLALSSSEEQLVKELHQTGGSSGLSIVRLALTVAQISGDYCLVADTLSMLAWMLLAIGDEIGAFQAINQAISYTGVGDDQELLTRLYSQRLSMKRSSNNPEDINLDVQILSEKSIENQDFRQLFFCAITLADHNPTDAITLLNKAEEILNNLDLNKLEALSDEDTVLIRVSSKNEVSKSTKGSGDALRAKWLSLIQKRRDSLTSDAI
ncbi:MAG: hypothetical protein R3C14_24505 [Caldilineaceae bacterium]